MEKKLIFIHPTNFLFSELRIYTNSPIHSRSATAASNKVEMAGAKYLEPSTTGSGVLSIPLATNVLKSCYLFLFLILYLTKQTKPYPL